jgi:catechol 2,3-dioxygenase-like lactoylglutathione lyase family enzyme
VSGKTGVVEVREKGMSRWRNLSQIAVSVMDLDSSLPFYEALGYRKAGGTDKLKGRVVSKIQGHKGVKARLRWLNDGSPGFQLELFQYKNPPARPMARDTRPCDIGYRRMSLWVADLDAVLGRLEARGTHFLSGPRTTPWGRRACVRDPDGVFVELMEEDVLPPQPGRNRGTPKGSPVRTRALTLSVPDLEQAERYFRGILGMKKAYLELHTPDMEEMWGLEGAKTKSTLLRCDDFLLELVEYVSPRGKPRPSDERIGDTGIWHVALWFHKGRYVRQAYREAVSAGLGSCSQPVSLGLVTAVYMKTDQGFTVEYFHAPRAAGRLFGFLS